MGNGSLSRMRAAKKKTDKCRSEHLCTNCMKPLIDLDYDHVTCVACRKKAKRKYKSRKGFKCWKKAGVK